MLPCHFFRTFHEKPPVVMPISDQKNVNSVNTTQYYGPKKSIGCPFFPIFHWKITALIPIFCKKHKFSKKQSALKYIFNQKTSIISKYCALMSFFSNFSYKSPAVKPILSPKNVNIVKTTLMRGPKSQLDAPFFWFLTKKKVLSCAYFDKKRPFSKKHYCYHAHILAKKR